MGLEEEVPMVMVTVDKQGPFSISRNRMDGSENVIVRHRVESAVKAVRVQVRQLGVRLGPPVHEQPPAAAVRRFWLFFPGGRIG
jgi:hypothetical protein